MNYFFTLKNLPCLSEHLFYCFLFAIKWIFDILEQNVQVGTLKKLDYGLLTVTYKTFRNCLAYSIGLFTGTF